MKSTQFKHKTTFSILFPLFFSFFLGIIGGWYVGQKKAGLPWQNLSIFSLRTSLSGQSLSEAEPNDSPDQATPLPFGVPVKGTLNTGKDVDFFKVTIEAPSRIRIAMTKLPQEYQLYIYNPTKQLIAASQRRGFLDTTSTFAAVDKGTYFIKIFTNYGETATFSYNITTTLLPLSE